jgi:hypothetical protein
MNRRNEVVRCEPLAKVRVMEGFESMLTGGLAVMKRNLESHPDWIVLNNTLETLSEWAATDDELKLWLKPNLERLVNDPRKSVAGRAVKKRKLLFGGS